MITANKFEIHYFLKDGSHSMDAIVKNKCEAEFLAVAYEIIDLLDLDITLDAEALREGGLREIWKWVGDNSQQITVILLLLSSVFAYQMIPDSELTELQKENYKLQNEQLKKQLNDNGVSKDDVDAHIKAANENQKIVTRRSNFYKTLHSNEKVEQVGFSTLDKNQKPLGEEIIIERPSFLHFIQQTNKLPVEIDDDARIEIFSPVLLESKAKWKGIYNEEPISFFMEDPDYKSDVLSKRVSFTRGNIIVCVLEIHKELNEIGEVVIKKYVVQTVLERDKNGSFAETLGGKKYRREKKIRDSQGELFN